MTKWLVCSNYEYDRRSFCLYTEASAQRLKGDLLRCIKHGRILDVAYGLDGMTRREARRAARGPENKA